MSDAVKPFIPDHASEFAHQLLSFIASKLTVQGHDQAVFGDIPNEPVPQVQLVKQSGMTLYTLCVDDLPVFQDQA